MNRSFILSVWIFMTAAPLLYAGNSHYADNQPPLMETPFTALPLGRVRAKGWLLKQLQMQAPG